MTFRLRDPNEPLRPDEILRTVGSPEAHRPDDAPASLGSLCRVGALIAALLATGAGVLFLGFALVAGLVR